MYNREPRVSLTIMIFPPVFCFAYTATKRIESKLKEMLNLLQMSKNQMTELNHQIFRAELNMYDLTQLLKEQ